MVDTMVDTTADTIVDGAHEDITMNSEINNSRKHGNCFFNDFFGLNFTYSNGWNSW